MARVRWNSRNLIAAAPLWILAAAYGMTLANETATFPGLARILRIEILVIHSFPFMVWITSVSPKSSWTRLLQCLAFGVLFALYAAIALATGWHGLGLFLSLTIATYVGFLLNLSDERRLLLLTLRWLVMFLLFIVVGVLTDLPERLSLWDRSQSTLYSGTIYFGILGLLELVGFFEATAGSPESDGLS